MTIPLILIIGEIGIFIVTLLIFLQKKTEKPTRMLLLLLGISFLLLSLLTVLEYMSFPFTHLPELRALQTVFWTSIITISIARLTRIKKLNYLILLIINSILFMFVTADWLIIVSTLSYYVAALSFFLLFITNTGKIKTAGIIGLASTILASIILYTGGMASNPLYLIPDLLLLISLSYFMRFKPRPPHEIEIDALEKGLHPDFWKPLGYIIAYAFLLNVSIIITSVGLHEMGHLAVGNMLGCSGGKVILIDMLLPTPGPYTELSCNFAANNLLLGLSGFLFIIPFGLIFLLLRRFPERNFGLVILGLAVSLSGLDLNLISPSPIIPILSILSGAAIITIGEIYFFYETIKSPKYQG